MGIFKIKSAASHLWNRLPFLISVIAGLCLFLRLSTLYFAAVGFVFLAAVVIVALDLAPPVSTRWVWRLGALVLTFATVLLGCLNFIRVWTPSTVAQSFAGSLHLSVPVFLLLLLCIAGLIGFYGIYTLWNWVISWMKALAKEALPTQSPGQMLKNLKTNWFFPISALAFFFTPSKLQPCFLAGIALGAAIAAFAATQLPSLRTTVKSVPWWNRIVSFVGAAGICWRVSISFNTHWLPNGFRLEPFIPSIAAVLSFYFVFYCLLIFWKRLSGVFSRTGLFRDLALWEIVVYGALILAAIAYTVVVFLKTRAFYGTVVDVDIIYTSDSPVMMKRNVFLSLFHIENDLRQPLFAVFASPFVSIFYFFMKLFDCSLPTGAILMNIPQLFMLLTANFILAKMLQLTPGQRVCFMLLIFSTYTNFLFVLMIEQYITSYFWLILCLFLISQKQPDKMVLFGAGGTLITSMAILPFFSKKHPVREFKAWSKETVTYGILFIFCILAFARFDVFYTLSDTIPVLNSFTGRKVTVTQKLFQYSEFIKTCFVAPVAGIAPSTHTEISWKQAPVNSISIPGMLILALVLVSAVLNRKKRSSRIAFLWVLFSIVMLFVLGWGTQENGLMLYGLYFGWAFIVLLFQLVQRLTQKIPFMLPVAAAAAAVFLFISNIPPVLDLLNFAITYYPK